MRSLLPLLWLSVVLAAAAQAAAPTLLTPLTGPNITNLRPASRGHWDGDLGIPLWIHPTPSSSSPSSVLLLLLGDVFSHPQTTPRTPNAINAPTNLTRLCDQQQPPLWRERSEDGVPVPPLPLLGVSTVPSGALHLPAIAASAATSPVYIFAMNVSDWRNGQPGNVSARGTLFRGAWTGSAAGGLLHVDPDPDPVWRLDAAPADLLPLTNVAPLLVSGAGSQVDMVYLWTTGTYRASGVYLARVLPSAIGNLSAYEWWDSRQGRVESAEQAVGGQGTRARQPWQRLARRARAQQAPHPLLDPTVFPLASGVGELSAIFHTPSGRFVLCFFSYSAPASPGAPWFVCTSAPAPHGPYRAPVVLFTGAAQAWWPPGACCIYGGYLLADPSPVHAAAAASANSTTAVLVLSLFVPYRSYAVAIDLAPAL